MINLFLINKHIIFLVLLTAVIPFVSHSMNEYENQLSAEESQASIVRQTEMAALLDQVRAYSQTIRELATISAADEIIEMIQEQEEEATRPLQPQGQPRSSCSMGRISTSPRKR